MFYLEKSLDGQFLTHVISCLEILIETEGIFTQLKEFFIKYLSFIENIFNTKKYQRMFN